MGSQLDPLPLSRVGSRERASKSQLPQLDFVKPSSGFHPVTWERVNFPPARIFSAWNREASSSLLLPPHVTCVRRCERPSPRSRSIVRVAKEGRPCELATHSAPVVSSLIPRSSEVATKEIFFATTTKPRPKHILPMCGLSLGFGFTPARHPEA
jgi:hypothetical protein